MKRLVPVAVVVMMLIGGNLLIGAEPDAQWLGVLWTKGGVSVGNARVTSGTTVLPGDVISTSENASAWVRFRSPASTILLADTEVVMLASDSAPSLLLRRGKMVVEDKSANPVQVAVKGGYVLVKGDPANGAQCEVASIDKSATVSVIRGVAEIHGQGVPVLLHAGQSARVDAKPQGGGGQQVAGRIGKEIPQGVIQRQGQTQDLPLTLNEVINWNDLVKTLEKGRAQIILLDGSTLNVGARSQIKVIKHDPETQQTKIELAAGRLQATAQKITTPGGKFELRTKSAVIGTIDTSYVAQTDESGTKICGVEGTTMVGSTDPNITKTVTLHKDECTFVPVGGAPTDPVFSPGETASLLDQTGIAGAGGAAGVGGGAVGGIGPWTWVAIGGAAGAVGGAVAGIVTTSPGTTSPTTP